jgi:hypothetical protein
MSKIFLESAHSQRMFGPDTDHFCRHVCIKALQVAYFKILDAVINMYLVSDK